MTSSSNRAQHEAIRDFARRVAHAAPALTDAQRSELAAIFRLASINIATRDVHGPAGEDAPRITAGLAGARGGEQPLKVERVAP